MFLNYVEKKKTLYTFAKFFNWYRFMHATRRIVEKFFRRTFGTKLHEEHFS